MSVLVEGDVVQHRDTGVQAAIVMGGKRLHLNHGPIDLLIEADGSQAQVTTAFSAAIARFDTVLTELVTELDRLRRPVQQGSPQFAGAVAKRMWRATLAHCGEFVTPMAAVAGGVADEVLGAMSNAASLRRAFVNNGGDIAIHLAQGEQYALGLVTRLAAPEIAARSIVHASDCIGGVATSGYAGRSASLGIADAVTVFAKTAASADVAATLIGNAIDLPGDDAVERCQAIDMDPDSDLGERLVTLAVGQLSDEKIRRALARGTNKAQAMLEKGLIASAVMVLQGRYSYVMHSGHAGALQDSGETRSHVRLPTPPCRTWPSTGAL